MKNKLSILLNKQQKEDILFKIKETIGSDFPNEDYVCSVEYEGDTWEMVLEETLPIEDYDDNRLGGHVFKVFNKENEAECFYVMQWFSTRGLYFSKYYFPPYLCTKKAKIIECWERE